MNIRCERCSTTYELDESLLAPEGSPVQCTKCQHVFTAVPPRTPGRTLVGVPAAPAPAPVATPRTAATADSPGVSPRQGPSIYRPSQASASPASAARTARARRDTMGAFEARLKASARLRWVVPLVAVILGAAALGVWYLVSTRVDPVAARLHAEAMALVALDDIESLEKASRILEEVGGLETGTEALDADRALAQLLLATGLLEDVAGPAAKLAARTAERERLAAGQPPAAQETLAALGAEIEALRGQVEPRRSAGRALAEKAYASLTKVSGERGNELAVARALAIHYASVGDREQALRFVRAAGVSAEKDPWIQLAQGWLEAREEAKEPRERAVAKLAALVAARPEVVRARFLLARTQAALGKREAAAATLDGLLAVNPRHGRAKRLKAELVTTVPPAAPSPVTPSPALAPPPRPILRPVGASPPGAPAAPAGAVIQPRPPLPGPAVPVAAPKPALPAPAVAPVLPGPATPAPARPAAPVAAPAPPPPALPPAVTPPPKVDAPPARPPPAAPPQQEEAPVGG